MELREDLIPFAVSRPSCVEGTCGMGRIRCAVADQGSEPGVTIPCPRLATGYAGVIFPNGRRTVLPMCSTHIWSYT